MAYFDNLWTSSKSSSPKVSNSQGGYFGSLFASPSAKPTVTKPTTPIQKTVQKLNTPEKKPKTTFKVNSAVKLNLVDQQMFPSAKMKVTKKSLEQDAKSIEAMDKFSSQVAAIFPTTNQTFKELGADFFSLKVNPNKAIDDFVTSIKEPLKQEKERILKFYNVYSNPKSSQSAKEGAKIEVITGGAGVVFSPITGLFAAAKNVPILGTAARVIELPFSIAGESAAGLAGGVIDVLPIPDADKKNIKTGFQEIAALAAQIALGKATAGKKGAPKGTMEIADISLAKKQELIKKYGLQDALTIEAKAKELAKQKNKLIEEGKTYTPDELIDKVIDSTLENTPEGKQIIKAAVEAKRTGKNVEVSPSPSFELLGKDTTVYRGAKVENIDVSRPNGITGGVSFSTDKAVAKRFAEKEGGQVREYTISKDAIVVNHSALEGMSQAERTAFLKDYKVDAVRFDVPKGVQGEAEIRVLNNRVLRAAEEAPKPKGQSKIGLSIERKAVESGLTKKFEGVAEYDKISIADQAKQATDLVTKDFERARRIVRGEEELPGNLRGTALITAMEEHIKKTGDADVAYELANSRLVSQTSAAAQELRLAAEREPDSLAVRLRQLREAKEEGIKKRTGKDVDKAIKNEVDRIKVEVKKKVPKREDWKSFIDSIEC